MPRPSRREFLQRGSALAAAGVTLGPAALMGDVPDVHRGERPEQEPGVEILNPRGRVPLSFIIDDSTCLVNMGHYCMPQFAEAWPERQDYKKPWKTWPREIPDDFVREFGEWCGENGVKGKYSIVPYPACVGWVDRELPGWSRSELQASLKLVRELMVPNWDIHPEMITHTRMIDIRSGRPFQEISAHTMENWFPQREVSVDELASYMAYALRVLKNCDLPCEGVTTPGGFGSGAESQLSLAVHQAVRDVYGTDLPHYFKYVSEGDESTRPMVEHVRGLGTDDPHVVVNVPSATGDWFGGWDGDLTSQGHRYADAEARSGRLVELVEAGEPAVFLCHWPGMYTQGTREGFRDFQGVVRALAGRFRDETIWMKVSAIGRYWAARELTAISLEAGDVVLEAPFDCTGFTLSLSTSSPPRISRDGSLRSLEEVKRGPDLRSGTWHRDGDRVTVCFDLQKGRTTIV